MIRGRERILRRRHLQLRNSGRTHLLPESSTRCCVVATCRQQEDRGHRSLLLLLSRLEQECGSSADPTLLLTQAEQNSAVDSASHATSHWPFIDGTARIGVSNGPGQALISAQAALRITCDCEVHRVVINPAGLPLDVGRSMRTFPPHLRKALSLRAEGLCVPRLWESTGVGTGTSHSSLGTRRQNILR